MKPEEDAVCQILAHIYSLGPTDQQEIAACVTRLAAIISEYGQNGCVALAFVGATVEREHQTSHISERTQ